MAAHSVAFIDDDIEDIDPFDLIDVRIKPIARRMRRDRSWDFFPFGYGTEANGAHVIVDRRRHPFCRKHRSGDVEIIPMVDYDSPIELHFKAFKSFYGSGWDHVADNEQTQQAVIGVVQRLGLEGEVYGRYLTWKNRLLRNRQSILRLCK